MRRLLLASLLSLLMVAPVQAVPDQGSIALVSDGSPAYGEFVSFTGTAPARLKGHPFVYLECLQDGDLVGAGYHRLIDGATAEFGLYSTIWNGGDATCTGSIADISGQRDKLYASVTFEVAP